ncbi:MAG: TonB-dependent receptor [Candidatus Kapabacteria bacterium]|nr:TonB-dependent receptor [Candidatus Kapabacteria bacterium]
MGVGPMINNSIISLVLLCAVYVGGNAKHNGGGADGTVPTSKDTVVMRVVEVLGLHESPFLITKVDDVEAGVIFAGKKTERITLANVVANTATNNARQTFSGVAGMTIWESDAAGLQLGIGARGLNPNRTSNFTTRQNGYDISADPLGYPESYYMPPLQALERIDIVRGAGALRYGTQFGGVVNFIMREGPRDEPLAGEAMLTGGSFGFVSVLARVGGTINKTTYTALYQQRRADGWRANSDFGQHLGYVSLTHSISQRIRLKADVTMMTYLAHQPGGLTDRQFAIDAQTSQRARNWFSVDWLLSSLTADWIIDSATSLRSMTFVNSSSRAALGNLDRINMVDLGGARTMIDGQFRNIGNETTLQHDFHLGTYAVSLLGGFRLFSGTTVQRQGTASDASDADFRFVGRGLRDGSDFRFPNTNAAVFAEAVIAVSDAFRIVPGMRLEHIATRAEGSYGISVRDLAGNLVVDSIANETRQRDRSISLLGLGMSYRAGSIEIYGNLTQNYRSITFSDLRIINPNLSVDPNISDERGWTADIGLRGTVDDLLTLDASVFYLRYNNKIGEVLRSDRAPLYLPYRYRTNVGDAYTTGIEAMTEVSLTRLMGYDLEEAAADVHLLLNGSVIRGRYIVPNDPTIDGKDVEYVPEVVLRTGIIVRAGAFRGSFLLSSTGRQYTDATNAVITSSAVSGVLAAYTVADLTVSYVLRPVTLEVTCNNLLGARYATRRAESYPGPGLIPAEPRSIFVGVRCAF